MIVDELHRTVPILTYIYNTCITVTKLDSLGNVTLFAGVSDGHVITILGMPLLFKLLNVYTKFFVKTFERLSFK
jgi:hypothetical protein